MITTDNCHKMVSFDIFSIIPLENGNVPFLGKTNVLVSQYFPPFLYLVAENELICSKYFHIKIDYIQYYIQYTYTFLLIYFCLV